MNVYNCGVSNGDSQIVFTIDSNRTILDDELSLYNSKDEINVKIVNDLVKEFNRISNGLILDYDYRMIDKYNICLEILFKQVFSKFGEVQRYVNYKITYDEKTKSLSIVVNKGNIGLNNIRNCQQFPFERIHIINTKTSENMNQTVITAHSSSPISTYKNYKMIIDFTKRLIYDNYTNIDNYIKISKHL